MRHQRRMRQQAPRVFSPRAGAVRPGQGMTEPGAVVGPAADVEDLGGLAGRQPGEGAEFD
jgi:hypothetical protein